MKDILIGKHDSKKKRKSTQCRNFELPKHVIVIVVRGKMQTFDNDKMKKKPKKADERCIENQNEREGVRCDERGASAHMMMTRTNNQYQISNSMHTNMKHKNAKTLKDHSMTTSTVSTLL